MTFKEDLEREKDRLLLMVGGRTGQTQLDVWNACARIYEERVRKLEEVRDAAADLMNNYEKCSQYPENITRIERKYTQRLREALIANDKALQNSKPEGGE